VTEQELQAAYEQGAPDWWLALPLDGCDCRRGRVVRKVMKDGTMYFEMHCRLCGVRWRGLENTRRRYLRIKRLSPEALKVYARGRSGRRQMI